MSEALWLLLLCSRLTSLEKSDDANSEYFNYH